jgi:hypothetical protein
LVLLLFAHLANTNTSRRKSTSFQQPNHLPPGWNGIAILSTPA